MPRNFSKTVFFSQFPSTTAIHDDRNFQTCWQYFWILWKALSHSGFHPSLVGGIVYLWLGDVKRKGWEWWRVGISISLTFLAPVMLLVLTDGLYDYGYIGMNDGGYSSTYGDLIMPAFNMYAPQHAEQAYWSEVDLYIYGDEPDPVVNFNYNYADFLGSAYPNNDWVVIQVDFNDGNVYLASPWSIYTDFNSGFQEWYLPTFASYVTDSFRYEVFSYDWFATEDFAGEGYFDVTRPPLVWDVLDIDWDYGLYDPLNESFSLLFGIDDLAGYQLSKPKGIMLVDNFGKPGIGQATYWPLSPNWYLNLPLISK